MSNKSITNCIICLQCAHKQMLLIKHLPKYVIIGCPAGSGVDKVPLACRLPATVPVVAACQAEVVWIIGWVGQLQSSGQPNVVANTVSDLH